MTQAIMAVGGRRMCGSSRTQGGIYLECGVSAGGSPVECFLLDPPQIIDPATYGVTALGVQLVTDGRGVTHVIDWVGTEHYPYVTDFIEEVRRMGVSRKVALNVDFSKLTRESRLILLHAKAGVFNALDYTLFLQNFQCPCGKEHQAGDPCIGLHWHVTPSEQGVRQLADDTYRVQAMLPGHPAVDYRTAMFMSVPITHIGVIKAADGSHQKAQSVAQKSSLPVTVVDA